MIKIFGALESNVASLDAINGVEEVAEFETQEEAESYLSEWVDSSGKPKDFPGNWMKDHYRRVYCG